MARIIGGIGTSHVPTIAMAFDKGRQNDPDWQPLFKGYEPVAKWLAEKKPDVLFVCFNDHATSFFFDHYPTFALGVDERYAIADEGTGQRNIPPDYPAGAVYGNLLPRYFRGVYDDVATLPRKDRRIAARFVNRKTKTAPRGAVFSFHQ